METDKRLPAGTRSGQGGFVIWLTGLPAAGKTTLARQLIMELTDRGCCALLLDSDELRAVLTPQPSFTSAERDWFYAVLGHLAAWLADNGINVCVAATANRRVYRNHVRRRVTHFAEVHVRCAPAICRKRDPKGIYRLAGRGDALSVPGAGADYEPPDQPEAEIDTDQISVIAAAASLLEQLASFLAPFCDLGEP